LTDLDWELTVDVRLRIEDVIEAIGTEDCYHQAGYDDVVQD
jgi:hypothetical protein